MSTTVKYKGATLTTATNQTRTLTTAGKYMEADVVVTDVTEGATLQSKTKSYTPTTSAQSDTVTADNGYDGLSSVTVNVAAMPNGTAGTPSATKGTVSNHAVTVTPSVTNSTGYITGGTKTGTGVTVSASELVSGTRSISENGTGIDVTNYASVNVAVPTGGGGASNVVEGEFTTQASSGVQTISIPYTGSGYPVSCLIWIKGGAYNSAITDWYSSVQRYAIGLWGCTKSVTTSSPTYTTSGTQNQAVTFSIYKNSTSSSTAYTRTSAMNTNTYSSSNASNAAATAVRFRSATSLSVYVASTSYGLMDSITYQYIITYSA